MTRKFTIVYKNGQDHLAVENRTHESGIEPSETMVRNCLHTLCVGRKIFDFSKAKAFVYETTGGQNKLITTYILITRGMTAR